MTTTDGPWLPHHSAATGVFGSITSAYSYDLNCSKRREIGETYLARVAEVSTFAQPHNPLNVAHCNRLRETNRAFMPESSTARGPSHPMPLLFCTEGWIKFKIRLASTYTI